jgi:phage shock protein PspC (stress-responsive transcriptional regulator)
METIHTTLYREGLVRPREGRVLGGVCAGLGRRFGIDPWPARLLFILILMVIPGSQVLIYPVLWILMPSESDVPSAAYVPPAADVPSGTTTVVAPQPPRAPTS